MGNGGFHPQMSFQADRLQVRIVPGMGSRNFHPPNGPHVFRNPCTCSVRYAGRVGVHCVALEARPDPRRGQMHQRDFLGVCGLWDKWSGIEVWCSLPLNCLCVYPTAPKPVPFAMPHLHPNPYLQEAITQALSDMAALCGQPCAEP